MKGTKGITLIALVITIIVMLILVAVTLTIAIQGGLFSQATDAGTKTQAALISEKVLGAQATAYGAYYDPDPANTDRIFAAAKAFANDVNSVVGTGTVTEPSATATTFTFTINKDGYNHTLVLKELNGIGAGLTIDDTDNATP